LILSAGLPDGRRLLCALCVLESTRPLFERAAINAASKFQFKPKLEDGQPVEVKNVQQIISFEEDCNDT
jgi:hypothetical protein